MEDVPVVVGAGLAGLMTALQLAPQRVIVLAKTPLGEGAASAWSQGGIAAALSDDDSPELHANDTMAVADGLGDPMVAARITSAGPGAVAMLQRLGVPFDLDVRGRPALGLEAAHSRRRIAHVTGDGTGAAIMRAVIAAVRATPSIIVLEGFEARRLLVDDGRIAGVLAVGPAGARLLPARRIVLATGGLGGLFAQTTNPLGSIGQGIALAARAGAVLADMEFVQFHPTALDVAHDPMPLVSEAVRGEGAVLIDETGTRFMQGQGRAELEPRDVVSRAVAKHRANGHRVFLDTRPSLGVDFGKRFPTIAAHCRAGDIDPATMPIPVAPAAHFHMGGIAVDLDGRTTVEGLWACGETAATGLHGANRLASNSLLEAAVMASRVARSVATTAARSTPSPRPVALPPTPDASAIRRLVGETLGIVRDGNGLLKAIDRLEPLAFSSDPTADPALVALFIARAALQREESRGGHWRSDFPQRSARWARHQMQRLDPSRTSVVSTWSTDHDSLSPAHAHA
ncbi:L-aspartate oxidase [Enhydrobacter aerosaccus]|uniref:L-aspartate oxidase n=1 Tax=Enhydrobacter aerosaccus TaxID=225324 RepID=A0A1T4JX16_9HYPH|nr:L-aspartate oxidase [Enhydrobacter aerosaccus]SJZ34673.1 L-aspartate oxidase [Enhydrobacter aerosaccus]